MRRGTDDENDGVWVDGKDDKFSRVRKMRNVSINAENEYYG